MARTITEYGTVTPVTITLNGLASGSSRESAAIDNSSAGFLDMMLEITIVLPAGTPPAGATIDVFIAPSMGGTVFPTPATGTDSAIVIPDPTMLVPLYTIPVLAGGTTLYAEIMSVATALAGGLLPRKFSVVIRNNSGLAFSGSGHAVQYSGVYALTQ